MPIPDHKRNFWVSKRTWEVGLQMNRLKLALTVALFLWSSLNAADAQSSAQPSPTPEIFTLTSRSNLVLVPVLVKTKAAKVVLSLTAEDFILTDNGVPQSVRIEDG